VIIWGFNKDQTGLGFAAETCESCHHPISLVLKRRSRFTLFFVPLFAYRNDTLLQCLNCHYERKVGLENVRVLPTVEAATRSNAAAQPRLASRVIHPPDADL
jgi:hypothetical protein